MNPSDTLCFALDDRINDVPVGPGHVPPYLPGQAEENLKTSEPALLAFAASPPHWDKAEFDKLVQKGTQAWADVPDNWLEELRGTYE